jgi:3D (Asp-Asp-Asp) domain-containing protein
MIIARSLRRKIIVTSVAAISFVALYEVTILDSQRAAREAELRESSATPAPGVRLAVRATAYCKGSTTTSGVVAQQGVAAADPQLLPVGSVVQLDSSNPRYDGIYTVMDTGPSVHGRQIDIYMWNCNEALAFGRQTVRVLVLRLGWSPSATSPASRPVPRDR